MGELAFPFTFRWWNQWPELTNFAVTQARIQAFELALSNISPFYDLLECVKELVLQNRAI